MLNLKKTAVAVLAFSSSAAFAGTMGPVCTPGNVTVPCEKNAWDFGAQALYLKPVYDADFGYVGSSTNASGVEVYRKLDPNWGWGFQIEGSYHFSTGNDVNLNWYHFSKGSTAHYLLDEGVDTNNVALYTKPKWDAVNLEFAQHVDFGDMSNIRFHAGAQYARIETEFKSTVNSVAGQNAESKYNGFGPRFGADMSYDFGNGFALLGKVAGAVLVGSSKFNENLAVVFNGATTSRGSKTSMVPELEGKLEAAYTYAMPQGDVTVDLGYMWLNYFNAQTQGGDNFVAESDFGLNGLYFGLKWVGNV